MSARNTLAAVFAAFFAATALVAALVTYAASNDAGHREALVSLVRAVSFVPARRWSSASDYPELAEIYYFLVCPSFIAAFGAVFVKVSSSSTNKFGSDFTVSRRIKAAIASVLLLGFSLLILASAHGSDIRVFRFGTSFTTLLIFGWFNFALTGVLSALAIAGLVQCFIDRKRDL